MLLRRVRDRMDREYAQPLESMHSPAEDEQDVDPVLEPGEVPAGEHRRPNEINRTDGGRGLYFDDPNGHKLEIITRPYGSGA